MPYIFNINYLLPISKNKTKSKEKSKISKSQSVSLKTELSIPGKMS